MQLSLYETLSCLSSCMLEAARAGEWEAVTAAERGCRAVVDRLRALGVQPLLPSEAAAKRVILMKLLAEDREIRDLAQP
jgi:flagellar protein FliT